MNIHIIVSAVGSFLLGMLASLSLSSFDITTITSKGDVDAKKPIVWKGQYVIYSAVRRFPVKDPRIIK